MENMESVDSPPLTLCNFPPGCDAFPTQLRVYSKRKKDCLLKPKSLILKCSKFKGSCEVPPSFTKNIEGIC